MAMHTTGEWKESEAKKKWQKENTRIVSLKLQNSTDEDIIKYLDSVESKNGTIRKALRLLMAQEAAQAKKQEG